MENAKTFKERHEISSLLENEQADIGSSAINDIYQSIEVKSRINYGDIPDSKGDITKYSGYRQMMDVLTSINTIVKKQDYKVPEVEIVMKAVQNIADNREYFEKGYRLDKGFIIIQYNALVYACLESISIIIYSYLDYSKQADDIEIVFINPHGNSKHISIANLEKFNECVNNGSFQKTMAAIIKTDSEALLGLDDLVVPVFVIGALMAVIPVIRELIFTFYYSRMKISDYLKHQSLMLEINEDSVMASNKTAREKTKIVKSQQEKIRKLRKLSDKIQIDNRESEVKAKREINNENKEFTLDKMRNQTASTDRSGFTIL